MLKTNVTFHGGLIVDTDLYNGLLRLSQSPCKALYTQVGFGHCLSHDSVMAHSFRQGLSFHVCFHLCTPHSHFSLTWAIFASSASAAWRRGFNYSRRSAAGSARTKVTRCHKRKCRWRSRLVILCQIHPKTLYLAPFLCLQKNNCWYLRCFCNIKHKTSPKHRYLQCFLMNA